MVVRTVSVQWRNFSDLTIHDREMSEWRRSLSTVLSRWRAPLPLTALVDYPTISQVLTISGI
jgi:hypothetical protein